MDTKCNNVVFDIVSRKLDGIVMVLEAIVYRALIYLSSFVTRITMINLPTQKCTTFTLYSI